MLEFLQTFLSGLMTGGVYSLIALGIVLIYKSTRALNLAQGQLVVIGAWLFYTFLVTLSFPLWLSLPLTLMICAFSGFFLDRFTMRPLIGQPIVALIMMTIALIYTIEGLVLWIWGGYVVAYPEFIPKEPLRLGELVIPQQLMWIFIGAMVLIGFFALFFNLTKTGLAMRATAEDHQVAQSVGIRVKTVFSQTWAIAALIGGIGGIFLGSVHGASYILGIYGLKVLSPVIIGGLESIPGVVVAGLLVGVLEKLAIGYIDPLVGGGIEEVFPFIILLIILLIRPYGLFGLKRIERI